MLTKGWFRGKTKICKYNWFCALQIKIYNDVTRWKEYSKIGLGEVKSSFIIMIFIKLKIQITTFPVTIFILQNKNSKGTVSYGQQKLSL